MSSHPSDPVSSLATAAAHPEAEAFDATGMRVLVVDDNEQNVELLARLTGQPKEKLREDLAQDTYMDAAEAVAYGIADMVRARKDLSKPATAPAGDAADDDVTIEPPAPATSS